jgi:hypothetical protein
MSRRTTATRSRSTGSNRNRTTWRVECRLSKLRSSSRTRVTRQAISRAKATRSSRRCRRGTYHPHMPRYFKQLVKSITSRQLTYIVPPVLCNELTMFHEYHANLREYLEEGITTQYHRFHDSLGFLRVIWSQLWCFSFLFKFCLIDV